MGQRLDLQTLFETLAPHVYFQPPENLTMEYPCIVYNRDNGLTRFADNDPYTYTKGYQVTVMDRDPDSLIPDKVAKLPLCRFSRFFVVENLNHDVYSLFF